MSKNRSPTLDYSITNEDINIFNPKNNIPLTTKIFFLDNSYQLLKVKAVRCMYGSLDDYRIYKYNKQYWLHKGGEVVGRETHNKNFVIGKIVEFGEEEIEQALYLAGALNDSSNLTKQTLEIANILSFDSPEELYRMHFNTVQQTYCYAFPLNVMNSMSKKIIQTKHNRVRINGFKEILDDFKEM